MLTFAQKPKAAQQTSSAKPMIAGRARLGQSRDAPSLLHSQGTIANLAVQRLPEANTEDVKEDGSSTTEIPRFGYDFSRIPVYDQAPVRVQTKLSVSTPGDIYEQEVDRVADEVMRMPAPKLQRACACGGGCPKCRSEQPGHEHEHLQTKRVQAGDTGQITAPPIVDEVLRSPGQPLSPTTHTFFEPRFGHDFSKVRVHADTRASEAAQAVSAKAFTVGQDIVFGAGQYAPNVVAGRRLLAHELTHVVQQGGGAGVLQNGTPDPANGVFGQESDQVAHNIQASNRVTIQTSRLVPQVQKATTPDRVYLGPTDRTKTYCLKRFFVETSVPKNRNNERNARGEVTIKFEGLNTGQKDGKDCACECGIYRLWIKGYKRITRVGQPKAAKKYDIKSCNKTLTINESTFTEEHTKCIRDFIFFDGPGDCLKSYTDTPGFSGYGLGTRADFELHNDFAFEVWDRCQNRSLVFAQRTLDISGNQAPRTITWSRVP